MPVFVLLTLLLASTAHAQDPFEPDAAEVLGSQVGELGASIGDYVRLTAMRKARVEAAERAVKECLAISCGNRAALEKELAEARAVDAIVRSAEGALLAGIGLPRQRTQARMRQAAALGVQLERSEPIDDGIGARVQPTDCGRTSTIGTAVDITSCERTVDPASCAP